MTKTLFTRIQNEPNIIYYNIWEISLFFKWATKSKRTIETNSLRRDIEKCTSERLHGCFETKTGLLALTEYKHQWLFDRQTNAKGAHNIPNCTTFHNTHTHIIYMPGPNDHMCTYHFYWTKPESRSHARTHTMTAGYTGSVEKNSCIYWMRNEDTKSTKPTHWQSPNIISIEYESTEYEVVTAKYLPVFSSPNYLFILCAIHNRWMLNLWIRTIYVCSSFAKRKKNLFRIALFEKVMCVIMQPEQQ